MMVLMMKLRLLSSQQLGGEEHLTTEKIEAKKTSEVNTVMEQVESTPVVESNDNQEEELETFLAEEEERIVSEKSSSQ